MTPSSPSAKDMGPIERELRELRPGIHGRYDFISLCSLGKSAFDLVISARDSLGVGLLSHVGESRIPEVLSEAIEAASELGL